MLAADLQSASCDVIAGLAYVIAGKGLSYRTRRAITCRSDAPALGPFRGKGLSYRKGRAITCRFDAPALGPFGLGCQHGATHRDREIIESRRRPLLCTLVRSCIRVKRVESSRVANSLDVQLRSAPTIRAK